MASLDIQRVVMLVGEAMDKLTLIQPEVPEVGEALLHLRECDELIHTAMRELVEQPTPLMDPAPIDPTEQARLDARLGPSQALKPEALLGNKRQEF